MKILLTSFPGKELITPPIGIAYIASMLNKNNHKAIILEGNNQTVDSLIKKIIKIKPDILGISIITSSRHDCLKIAKEVKSKINIPIILGGPHATIMHKQLLKNYHYIDYIVRGEGEYVCLDLLNALERKEKLGGIKGLSYRNKKRIIENPAAEQILDLDKLPFPEYKFFNLKKYSRPAEYPLEAKKNNIGYLVSSRGCPHNCTFCSSSALWGRRIRFRSPENVVSEIEHLHKKYGIRYVVFLDDHFAANKQRAIEICKLMINKGLNKRIKWQCNSEVNVINKEVLGWMKKAGCYLICYGVEDASEEGLRFFKKAHKKEQVINAFELTKKAGIKALSYFIIGGDHESKKSIEMKKELIKKLDPELTTSSILVAFPGTEIFELGKERGFWNEDVLLKSCVGKEFYNGVPIFPSKNISLEEEFRATAGIDYWWNKKKGYFSFRGKIPVILNLIKNKDFHKIYAMSKQILLKR